MAYHQHQALDAPEVPEHPADSRLGESQAELEAEEDPRLTSDHDLPLTAERSYTH